jgi:hypothetical protein
VAFEAVPDLCELSARGDGRMQQLVEGGQLRIAACYPRAVKWLFEAAGAPLPESGVEIRNMRVEPTAEIAAALLRPASVPAASTASRSDAAETLTPHPSPLAPPQ